MKKPDRYLVKLGGIYYYQRRVPKRFSHIDARTKPRLSLRTGNLDLARMRRDLFPVSDLETDRLFCLRRISGSSIARQGSEDEQEIRAAGDGREACERHQAAHPPEVLS